MRQSPVDNFGGVSPQSLNVPRHANYPLARRWRLTAVEAFVREEPDDAPFLRADIDLAVAEAASDQELEKAFG